MGNNQENCIVDVSVVVPIHNEVENIMPLHEQLTEVLDPLDLEYEILCVDDGSRDGSLQKLTQLAKDDRRVKIISFRRNYGQTAAMQAGIESAAGRVIVTMDGDLQNDPADIPMMLEKIDAGYDLVHGWRKNRQDPWLNRRLPSKIANWLISRVTGFPIHDLGCTLKAMRTEIARDIELYGEMHRFIPILAHARGARCCEVVARHHPRRHGQTKYGISRTLRVILDLITVKYILDYFASPMKLFGGVGLGCSAVALLTLVATIGMKQLGNVDMTGNPLLLLAVGAMIAAIQFFSLGLLGEVNARIYYSHPERRPYAVRACWNMESRASEDAVEQHGRRAA